MTSVVHGVDPRENWVNHVPPSVLVVETYSDKRRRPEYLVSTRYQVRDGNLVNLERLG